MDEKTYLLLKRMEERPGLWLGKPTLKSIASFLVGYDCALIDHLLEMSIGVSKVFHDWVAERLGYSESTAGWANMILASVLGLDPKKPNWENYDESVSNEIHLKSIKQFYKLLDEYWDSH
ncbi:MAG: hypothetical protein MRY83_07305 [Flavobacteriales bacterium]|nr:hypothetical protein [Flavobacteriales bacterium]